MAAGLYSRQCIPLRAYGNELGFGFKVLTSSDPSEKTSMLSAELGNGRLARMAFIGMFLQDGLTGSA